MPEKILLTDARPVVIGPLLWLIVARAIWFDGDNFDTAKRRRYVRVREHADKRRLVYGVSEEEGRRALAAGYLVQPIVTNVEGQPPVRDPDEANTQAAIKAVALAIGDVGLYHECLADFPATVLV